MRAERDYVFDAIGSVTLGEPEGNEIRRTWSALQSFLRDYGYDEMLRRVEWLESRVQPKGR